MQPYFNLPYKRRRDLAPSNNSIASILNDLAENDLKMVAWAIEILASKILNHAFDISNMKLG